MRGVCKATSWNALTLASSVDDTVDVDQDVPRSAEYLVVPVRRRINHEARVLYPTNELTHRDLSLQPRDRAAETEVDAAEWAPSTASKTVMLAVSIFRPDVPKEQT